MVMTYEVYAVYGSCIIIGTGSYIVQATFHDFGLCNINATMCSNVIKQKNKKTKQNKKTEKKNKTIANTQLMFCFTQINAC